MLGQGLLGFQRAPWPVSAYAPAAVHAPQTLPFRLCSKDSRTIAPTSLLLYPCHHCPRSLENSSNEEFCKGPWAALLPGGLWVLLPPGFGYVCPSFVLFFLYPHLHAVLESSIPIPASPQICKLLRGRLCETFITTHSALSTGSIRHCVLSEYLKLKIYPKMSSLLLDC